MKDCYVINRWVFTLGRVESDGTHYYRVVNPSGLVTSYETSFSSESEMEAYTKSHY